MSAPEQEGPDLGLIGQHIAEFPRLGKRRLVPGYAFVRKRAAGERQVTARLLSRFPAAIVSHASVVVMLSEPRFAAGPRALG